MSIDVKTSSTPGSSTEALPLVRRDSVLLRAARGTGHITIDYVLPGLLAITLPGVYACVKNRRLLNKNIEDLVTRIDNFVSTVDHALKDTGESPDAYDEPLGELKRTTSEVLEGVAKISRLNGLERTGRVRWLQKRLDALSRQFDDARNMFSVRVRFGSASSSSGSIFSSASTVVAPSSGGSSLGSLSGNAALRFSLSDFSTHIRENPDVANIALHKLVRRKDHKGVRHEFLIFYGTTPSGQEVWMRMERAARQDYTAIRLKSVSSVFPANDTVLIAKNPDQFLVPGTSDEEAIVDFAIPPLLSDLNRQLEALSIESANYTLLKENCYFFCSIIQELMTELYSGDLRVGKLANTDFGAKARKEIRARVLGELGQARAVAA